MKNFKKSKTNTSKAKTTEYFLKRKLCFEKKALSFSLQFFLHRNCLSKTPENITVQLLAVSAIVQSTSFRTTRKSNHFLLKCGLFH